MENEIKENRQPCAEAGDLRVYVRVTAEEKAKMLQNANVMGVTLSRYVRNSCLEKEIILIDDLKEFAKELNKIGTNLNQIARLCNEGFVQCPDIKETRDVLQKIYKELLKLNKKVRLSR